MLTVDAFDSGSGLKGGKLRFYPYNAGPQNWQEVDLVRHGSQWQAEVALEQEGVVYEVQVQMKDNAGNTSDWIKRLPA